MLLSFHKHWSWILVPLLCPLCFLREGTKLENTSKILACGFDYHWFTFVLACVFKKKKKLCGGHWTVFASKKVSAEVHNGWIVIFITELWEFSILLLKKKKQTLWLIRNFPHRASLMWKSAFQHWKKKDLASELVNNLDSIQQI